MKYSDTSYFHYVNVNPKNKVTDDCVVRAISTATEIPYEEVAKGLFDIWMKKGYHPCDTKCYDEYLKSIGWTKMKQPRKLNNTKYQGYECGKIFHQPVVAHLGGHHVVAVREYGNLMKVWDSWDSTDGCFGNYWIKTK